MVIADVSVMGVVFILKNRLESKFHITNPRTVLHSRAEKLITTFHHLQWRAHWFYFVRCKSITAPDSFNSTVTSVP